MARFDPDVRPTHDPSYIGYSREPDKQRPNNTLGDLFAGIGNITDNATKAVYQGITNNARNDVYAGVDAIRGGQGVDDANKALPAPLNLDKGGPASSATLVAGREGGGTQGATEAQRGTVQTNPMVENMRAQAQRLQEGYRQGYIGDNYYYTQLDALNRQLRAKYPGFREEIDSMIKEVTGIVPANALRKEQERALGVYQSELDKARNDKQKYIGDNADRIIQLHGREAFEKMYNNPDSVDMAKVRGSVGVVQAQELTVQQNSRQLEMMDKQNKLDKESATSMAIGEAGTLLDNAVVASTQGKDMVKLFQQAQTKQNAGQSLSPEEQQTLTSAFNNYKMASERAVDQMLNRPLYNKDGKVMTYAMIIGHDKANEVRAEAARRVSGYQEAIINKDFGLLAMDSRMIAARTDKAATSILGDPTFANLSAGRKLLGDPFVSSVLSDTNLSSDIMKKTRTLMIPQILNKGFSGIDDQMNRLLIMGKNNPSAKFNGDDIKTVIGDVRRGITEPTNSVEGRLRFADHMFGPENSNIIFTRFINDPKQRQQVYEMFVAPDVTKAMTELRKAGPEGEQAFQNYTNWARMNYGRLFKQDIDNIVQNHNDSTDINIKWDGKQFIPEMTPQGRRDWETRSKGIPGAQMPGGAPDWRQVVGTSTWDSINRLNKLNQAYESVATANGKKLEDDVRSIFTASGYNFDGTKPAKPGLIKSMWDALTSSGSDKAKSDPEQKLQDKATERFKEQLQQGTPAGPQRRSEGLSLEQTAALGIKDVIGGGEGGDYNRMFGEKRSANNLTNMTIGQVMDLQARHVAQGNESGAAGKYQVINSTLREAVAALDLDPNTTKFDEQTQEKIADYLLEKRGLRSYLAGDLTPQQFQNRLSMEWAGIPMTNGKSYYDGVGSNKATISHDAVSKAILSLRE